MKSTCYVHGKIRSVLAVIVVVVVVAAAAIAVTTLCVPKRYQSCLKDGFGDLNNFGRLVGIFQEQLAIK